MGLRVAGRRAARRRACGEETLYVRAGTLHERRRRAAISAGLCAISDNREAGCVAGGSAPTCMMARLRAKMP